MNTENISLLLILEAVLPFVVLSILLILAIMAGRKKFKQAAKSLILDVKANEDKEKQAITFFLTEKLAIDEKAAKKKVKKIMNERKFLVRNLVSGILDKNVEAISQINQDLCRVTSRYHQLEVMAAPQEEPQQEISEEEQQALDSLKSEIKSLKQEIHITLTTLNNIFKEFSSMFGEDDIPEGEMSVDQIITAMESFSGKDAVDNDDSFETDEIEDSNENLTDDLDLSDDEPQTAPQTAPAASTEPQTESQETQQQNTAMDEESSVQSYQKGEESLESSSDDESLDFAVDSAIDDIDSALDELELGESEDDDDEPDWGDAFAESGDKMEGEPK